MVDHPSRIAAPVPEADEFPGMGRPAETEGVMRVTSWNLHFSDPFNVNGSRVDVAVPPLTSWRRPFCGHRRRIYGSC